MDDLIKELTPEMLPSELYQQIAGAVGMEGFYKLAQAVGGLTIYVPLADSLLRPVRDARIKAEFNGCNHTALAEKYGVTERRVRQLCGDGFIEGQINFFEDTEKTKNLGNASE